MLRRAVVKSVMGTSIQKLGIQKLGVQKLGVQKLRDLLITGQG
nr:K283 [uncultured bacterium]